MLQKTFQKTIGEPEKMHLPLRFCLESPRHEFCSEKCVHMLLWIENPLCDDTACWHAALRVLRAEAAKLYIYIYICTILCTGYLKILIYIYIYSVY